MQFFTHAVFTSERIELTVIVHYWYDLSDIAILQILNLQVGWKTQKQSHYQKSLTDVQSVILTTYDLN